MLDLLELVASAQRIMSNRAINIDCQTARFLTIPTSGKSPFFMVRTARLISLLRRPLILSFNQRIASITTRIVLAFAYWGQSQRGLDQTGERPGCTLRIFTTVSTRLG